MYMYTIVYPARMVMPVFFSRMIYVFAVMCNNKKCIITVACKWLFPVVFLSYRECSVRIQYIVLKPAPNERP